MSKQLIIRPIRRHPLDDKKLAAALIEMAQRQMGAPESDGNAKGGGDERADSNKSGQR